MIEEEKNNYRRALDYNKDCINNLYNIYENNENQASLGFHFLHTATCNFHGKKNYQHLNHKGQPKALR